MNYKKWFVLVFLFLYLQCICKPATIKASEFIDDMDYTEIQQALEKTEAGSNKLDFTSLVKSMVEGDTKSSLSLLGSAILDILASSFSENRTMFFMLLSILIIAAIFRNFSGTFRNGQTAETGFYVTYLLLYGILAASFLSAATLAGDTLAKILDFMKVLVPSYTLSVAFASGSTTSVVIYEGILILITVGHRVLIGVILPLTKIYMLTMLANNITKEDTLSRIAELLELFIRWTLKTLLALVIGIGTMQAMITPAVDQLKRTTFMKFTGAIPGVGNLISGVTETVLGAGLLLKNAIGLAGVIVLLVLCAAPAIKLVLFVAAYKFSGAVVQPVSDKRVLNCIHASASATGLLLRLMMVGVVMFILAITVVSVSFHK